MDYQFAEIEKKWQQYWKDNQVFKVKEDISRAKYYVLDMFPYPSGAGLHVGHPLGYIASDIYSRYKRLNGFNVLHPMGFDAYGLPAEQYAIQTGQHPAITTEKNIARYKEQLEKLGFSYDWSREVRTCDPKYYKWTQWTFIRLFESWYNRKTGSAEPISELITEFNHNGNTLIEAASDFEERFEAKTWNSLSEVEQQQVLMHYRLAYLSDTVVNWCPELGTVLANDEVKEGFSERGGHPVERKLMKQWSLRITAYAQRLLDGLDMIDWPESLREMQRNWIGRSQGGQMFFEVVSHPEKPTIDFFTTRPDTVFGATFMVLAPEHELVETITIPQYRTQVEEYISWAKNRSERERMSEVKKVSGVFTGAYALNPFTNQQIPVWVADYVLMGYGTGAIMAVPAHDTRDFAFARNFKLPIIQVVVPTNQKPEDTSSWNEAKDSKDGILINSGFISGMEVEKATNAVIDKAVEWGIGKRLVRYRLRDAIFSRQRYWGEPFPVYYKNGMPYPLRYEELPLELPVTDSYLPTETGEPPLARAANWHTAEGYPFETNTMPGFAGSCGYYLRFMDPHNESQYFSKQANDYWRDVDLYIGGAEHATGHLIYARFWNKFLFDIGLVCTDEPFRKLINQGMIQGRSNFVYRIKGTNTFVSKGLKENYETQSINVDIGLTSNDILDLERFRQWRSDFANASFILEDGKYVCGFEIEKMSKSLHNVVNPDELIERYGADTLRMYEMFLGPLEQSKPWDTHGIEGVFRFIRKLWRLFHDDKNQFNVSNQQPEIQELKVLHRTIQKVRDDTERFSFNTAVSALMICVNELLDLKCNKRAVLQELVILISPYAPHIAEELWHLLGNNTSVSSATFPAYDESLITEENITYPVSFNGKLRFRLELPATMTAAEIESVVLKAGEAQKWLAGQQPKKIIVVPHKIINIVV